MKGKRFLAVMLVSLLGMTACGTTAPKETETPAVQTEETAAVSTDAGTEEDTTEEVTEPPTNAPLPDADPNACTFDAVGADVAVLVVDDDQSVNGTLSIAEIDGNPMLKLTDETTNAENLKESVQKIRLDISKLLAKEQLELVDCIEFDLYAEAKDELFVNEDDENVRAPGWIGGGGGTECCDGKWYGFKDFSGSGLQEYVMERSDACHVQFKFLLAASGKKWDATMTQPFLQIMRWGMGNVSDLYLDNLTFFDADGNSIPLTISDGWAEYAPADENAETGTEVAETTNEANEEAAE